MKQKILVPILIGLMCASCGGGGKKGNLADGASGDIVAYQNSNVNAVEQARPSIMVIPSDMTIKDFGCLKQEKYDGVSYVIRDYQSYLIKDDRFRRISSTIQEQFLAQHYPLTDFEQTLKSLDTQKASDAVSAYLQDAKTQLLMVAKPDIILEIAYSTTAGKVSLTSHNYSNHSAEKNVSYTLSAIDAYTNKVVATITKSNMKGVSTTEEIQKDINKQVSSLTNDVQSYFSDILTRGRDISVRVNVDKGCNISLNDESIEGDTYTDWIIDYMKSHTIKGAYKMQINTNKEISFVNVRIKLLNEDGTQYGVYDWTRDFQKNLRQNLGVKCANNSQGLGEVVLTIKNI